MCLDVRSSRKKLGKSEGTELVQKNVFHPKLHADNCSKFRASAACC